MTEKTSRDQPRIQLGPMQKALFEAKLISDKDLKKYKKQKDFENYKKDKKEYKCHKCQNVMQKIPDSNIMYCTNCNQYYLFN